MTKLSSRSDTSQIIPIPNKLANDQKFADRFPLDGSVKFLDLEDAYLAIFDALEIRLVRDLFLKKYTHRKLTERSLITIADELNAALKKKGLPTLSYREPNKCIYAFFEPEHQAKLSLVQVEVLRNCHWGNIDPQIQAREMSDENHPRIAADESQIQTYTADDVERLINEALEILENQ